VSGAVKSAANGKRRPAITVRTLESFGYTVLTASDGAEALSLYAARPAGIDVVITDMGMPFMDGPTLIPILRRLTPDIRIIGVSGVASNDRAIRTMQVGTDYFLRKPYASGTLLRALREILQDRKV
jgi:CheY-like chemotaxis protein